MTMQVRWLVMIALCFMLPITVLAQETEGQFAAFLSVLDEGVEILHVNTSNWIEVKVESVVGVGDTIRTNAIGRAQINFIADTNFTILLPNTTYKITQFDVTIESYAITAELEVGQTQHRHSEIADSGATYTLETPGMTITSLGTQFTVRVEDSGRSAVLTQAGRVKATKGDVTAEVPAGFGARAEVDGALSDVVPARTFAELDAALDGCTITITTLDDVSLNVRTGPALSFEQVGYVSGADISTVLGANETGNWFRIDFQGGYGWVLASNARIADGCAGLRRFPDDFGPENTSLYTTASQTG